MPCLTKSIVPASALCPPSVRVRLLVRSHPRGHLLPQDESRRAWSGIVVCELRPEVRDFTGAPPPGAVAARGARPRYKAAEIPLPRPELEGVAPCAQRGPTPRIMPALAVRVPATVGPALGVRLRPPHSSAMRGHPLAQDEIGRARGGIVRKHPPEVRGVAGAPPPRVFRSAERPAPTPRCRVCNVLRRARRYRTMSTASTCATHHTDGRICRTSSE